MNSSDETSAPALANHISAIVDDVFVRYPLLSPARGSLIKAYRAIVQVFEQHGILYICGNGGSFADAMHIKGELAKSFEKPRPMTDPEVIARLRKTPEGGQLIKNLEAGLPVIVLGESHSLRSAYENDTDPVLSYAQELNGFAAHIKPGVLLGISTSGNAANVIAALVLARAYGFVTISFTGPDGGRLARWADIDWRVPAISGSAGDVQESHLPLYHALCKMIESHFFEKKGPL